MWRKSWAQGVGAKPGTWLRPAGGPVTGRAGGLTCVPHPPELVLHKAQHGAQGGLSLLLLLLPSRDGGHPHVDHGSCGSSLTMGPLLGAPPNSSSPGEVDPWGVTAVSVCSPRLEGTSPDTGTCTSWQRQRRSLGDMGTGAGRRRSRLLQAPYLSKRGLGAGGRVIPKVEG